MPGSDYNLTSPMGWPFCQPAACCTPDAIGNRQRRIPLGDVDELDVGEARQTAREILTAVRMGKDHLAKEHSLPNVIPGRAALARHALDRIGLRVNIARRERRASRYPGGP
jgi:hypothetical protein